MLRIKSLLGDFAVRFCTGAPMKTDSLLHSPLVDGSGLDTVAWCGLPPHTRAAMKELLRAFDYARTVARDVWAFAVEIEQLCDKGLTRSDFRWLACKGYIEHAREITHCNEDGRRFRALGDLSFPERTCFILTEAGAAIARPLSCNSLLGGAGRDRSRQSRDASINRTARGLFPTDDDGSPATGKPAAPASQVVPAWNAERRELRVSETLVKRFKWPAANQELVLTAFEEEGWPSRIDDPLPVEPEQDPKRRLHDTIKCLNRKQERPLLHFRGDGTGEGIVWEFIRCNGRDADG